MLRRREDAVHGEAQLQRSPSIGAAPVWIRTVGAGDSLLARSLIRRLVEEHLRRPPLYERVPKVLRDLTPHELGALVMTSRGLANDQIAKALVVSEATVKTHVNRI